MGAVLAVALSGVYLAYGMATDELWRDYPPPTTPFILLPLLVGSLAGIRITTEVVRPEHVSWMTLLKATVVALAVSATTLAAVATISTSIGSGYEGPIDTAADLAWAIVLTVPLAATWIIIPGILVIPVLLPVVWLFAMVMRTLARVRGRAHS